MIDKSESVNWPNVWWILGADHLTFEEVMGDFREKCHADGFREEKSMQINSWEKNIPHWKKYRSWRTMLKKILHRYMSWKKKFLTPERFGEKFFQDKNHPYPTPSQTSNGHVSHLGGEGRNGFDTFVNVIHQQNGWRAIMMWWVSRLKFCIKRLKIRR